MCLQKRCLKTAEDGTMATRYCRTARLTNERNDVRRGRDGFGNEQLVDSHRQQDGDAQRYLLAGLGRQAEHQDADDHQQDAREHEVVREKHRLTSQHDRVRDVHVRLDTARVFLHVSATVEAAAAAAAKNRQKNEWMNYTG